MNKKLLLTSLILNLFLSSCATIFSPSKDNITFASKPEGAKIFVDGNYIGMTPLIQPIKRNMSSPRISFKKDGYLPRSIKLRTKFNNTTLWNALFPPGLLIDLATGSLIQYSETQYDVNLIPVE